MKTLEVLEEMFLVYVRSEQFGDLTEEGPSHIHPTSGINVSRSSNHGPEHYSRRGRNLQITIIIMLLLELVLYLKLCFLIKLLQNISVKPC